MAYNWRNKLANIIRDRELDMKEVSLKAGLNPSFVSELFTKDKDPQISSLMKIVNHLKLSYDELLTGVVPADAPRSVGVIGETAAGLWLEPDLWDEAKYPPVPFVPSRYSELEQRAYKVLGSSMNARGIHDGSFVITVAYADVRTQAQDGDIVVVERRRDGGLIERTLKEVVVRPDRIELTPRSTDERYQESLIIPRDAGRGQGDPTEIIIVALVIGAYTAI